MLLPWEYGVRNLARRPVRTALTTVALATVVMLVFVVVGFIRGLEQSLSVSGDEDVVLIYSVNSEENLESSSIAAQTPSLVTASIGSAWKRYGVTHVSPELCLGTRVQTQSDSSGLGLVRGVTVHVPLVRRSVKLISGEWPREGQVMVGRLAWAKLGCSQADLAIGRSVEFEGRGWTISGQFAAEGAGYESEFWCNLADFQTATQRQDLSLAAIRLAPGVATGEIELFCKERTDLELRATRETDYYASLQRHYRPVRLLSWLVVALVSAAGVFAGLNTMYGAVSGRIQELATLQAIGFRRRAVLMSLIQEGVLLGAAASLVSGAIALMLFNGLAVRFTMGAFVLRIDSVAILVGCGIGLMIGVLGSLPPAIKALRESVSGGLKAVG